MCKRLLIFAVVVSFSIAANATIINLNTGESAAVSEIIAGETWNNIPLAGSGTILDSTGGATSLSVGPVVFINPGTNEGANPNDPAGAGFGGTNLFDSMTTSTTYQYGEAPNTQTITVSGFTPGDEFNVFLVAGFGNHSAVITQDIVANNRTLLGHPSLASYNAGIVAALRNVVADVSGDIVMTLTSQQVSFAQGISIRDPDLVIPEPATIALLGLGGLALIRRRRV